MSDQETIFDRELRLIVFQEVMSMPTTTRCNHCGAEAPASRMPAGQVCHACNRGVMQ